MIDDGKNTLRQADMKCSCIAPGTDVIEVEEVLAVEMVQKVVEAELTIPTDMPEIKQVLNVFVKNVKVNSIDVIPGRVIIRGCLGIKVLYAAARENEPVYAFERKHLKFIRDIDVEGVTPLMSAAADCSVEYVDYDFNECEPRLVRVTAILKCWTRVTTTTEMEVSLAGAAAGEGTPENASSALGQKMVGSMSFDLHSGMAGEQSNTEDNASVKSAEVQPTESAESDLNSQGTITADRVNVRTGPGTNYPIVTKVSRGEVVKLKEQAFGWYKAGLANGNHGWIASWFVKIN